MYSTTVCIHFGSSSLHITSPNSLETRIGLFIKYLLRDILSGFVLPWRHLSFHLKQGPDLIGHPKFCNFFWRTEFRIQRFNGPKLLTKSRLSIETGLSTVSVCIFIFKSIFRLFFREWQWKCLKVSFWVSKEIFGQKTLIFWQISHVLYFVVKNFHFFFAGSLNLNKHFLKIMSRLTPAKP